MKTITIPTTCNPYIVVINNHAYTYRAGDTVDVPDEVAEAIEDALELEPKPKKYLSRFALRAQGTLESITAEDLDGCTTIGTYAFYMCDKLGDVKIPGSVVSIGDRAFGTCYNLRTVAFDNDSLLESIGGNAFAYDYRLSTINIPKGVKSIGESALAYCHGLTKVTVEAITPPAIQANTFMELPTSCVVEVPSEAVETYQSAPNWGALAGQIIAIEE